MPPFTQGMEQSRPAPRPRYSRHPDVIVPPLATLLSSSSSSSSSSTFSSFFQKSKEASNGRPTQIGVVSSTLPYSKLDGGVKHDQTTRTNTRTQRQRSGRGSGTLPPAVSSDSEAEEGPQSPRTAQGGHSNTDVTRRAEVLHTHNKMTTATHDVATVDSSSVCSSDESDQHWCCGAGGYSRSSGTATQSSSSHHSSRSSNHTSSSSSSSVLPRRATNAAALNPYRQQPRAAHPQHTNANPPGRVPLAGRSVECLKQCVSRWYRGYQYEWAMYVCDWWEALIFNSLTLTFLIMLGNLLLSWLF